MGQRLPGQSSDWARFVIEGNDKRFMGEAAAYARGMDALGRGIQAGVAGLTAGINRKRSDAREDAQRAQSDARWQQEFSAREAERTYQHGQDQSRKDASNYAIISNQEQSAAEALYAATTVGDPAEVARLTEQMKRYQVMKQTLEGRLMPEIQARQGASMGERAPRPDDDLYPVADRLSNMYPSYAPKTATSTASSPSSMSPSMSSSSGMDDQEHTASCSDGSCEKAPMDEGPTDPLGKALAKLERSKLYEARATGRSTEIAREISAGDSAVKKSPALSRAWQTKKKALLDEQQAVHEEAVREQAVQHTLGIEVSAQQDIARRAREQADKDALQRREFEQTSATAMNDPYARAYLGEDPTAEVEKIDAEGNTIGFGTDARRPANLVEAKTALEEASRAAQSDRVLGRTNRRIEATNARAEADREERRKEAEKRRAFQLSLYERRFSARNAEKELAADEDAKDEFNKYAYQRNKDGSFTLRKSIPWTQISPESQKRLMDMARDGNDLLPYEARTAVLNAGPSSGAEQDAMRNVPRGTMPEQGGNGASPEVRSKATAEFKALAPEQQTAEAWAAIKARYKIP